MMHITEDTPPDMLAGAMDLTVHLPNGRSVKMSVERCTPMMDVLMQITTAHQLQLSGYVIEALGMAPSSEYSDKILPYKPNTPIGTLDTQHIRVVPKPRTLPVPKNIPPGHQPFESTFRLKVHLPRKQLFVSRVSMNVLLKDIMRKVCDEKNLDPNKYEFRHPDNQNEVLDPKLTLEDYKITEIYVVSKGSSRLSQAFSASDIMALRKDDERKHSKSSGGVFNLIFKRGKMSNGSGSVSSDNRSISPTHSDDSRSVTPPAIQQQLIKTTAEKPKAPLRKRRPAPKPPQPKEETKPVEIPTSEAPKKNENGLTICHSRNSSDSSGYHEASILSDNANTSLPRRPQTMIMTEEMGRNKLNGEHSKSTSNLATMSLQSKSTSSLAFTGRKKKAPPPPPVLKSASSVTNLEKASPVVASPVEQRDLPTAQPKTKTNNVPVPAPRKIYAKLPTSNEISENRQIFESSEGFDVSGGNYEQKDVLEIDKLNKFGKTISNDDSSEITDEEKKENLQDEIFDENNSKAVKPKGPQNYFMLLQKSINDELKKINQQKTNLKPVLRNWRSEENVYNFNSGEITTNRNLGLFNHNKADKLKKQKSFPETNAQGFNPDEDKQKVEEELKKFSIEKSQLKQIIKSETPDGEIKQISAAQGKGDGNDSLEEVVMETETEKKNDTKINKFPDETELALSDSKNDSGKYELSSNDSKMDEISSRNEFSSKDSKIDESYSREELSPNDLRMKQFSDKKELSSNDSKIKQFSERKELSSSNSKMNKLPSKTEITETKIFSFHKTQNSKVNNYGDEAITKPTIDLEKNIPFEKTGLRNSIDDLKKFSHEKSKLRHLIQDDTEVNQPNQEEFIPKTDNYQEEDFPVYQSTYSKHHPIMENSEDEYENQEEINQNQTRDVNNENRMGFEGKSVVLEGFVYKQKGVSEIDDSKKFGMISGINDDSSKIKNMHEERKENLHVNKNLVDKIKLFEEKDKQLSRLELKSEATNKTFLSGVKGLNTILEIKNKPETNLKEKCGFAGFKPADQKYIPSRKEDGSLNETQGGAKIMNSDHKVDDLAREEIVKENITKNKDSYDQPAQYSIPKEDTVKAKTVIENDGIVSKIDGNNSFDPPPKYPTPKEAAMLNSKDQSIKRQRDIKYIRMSSFIHDSEEFDEPWSPVLTNQIDSNEKAILKDQEGTLKKTIEDGNSNELLNETKINDILKLKDDLTKRKIVEEVKKTEVDQLQNSKNKNVEDKSRNSYMQAIENIDVDLFNPKYRKTAMPLFPKPNDLENKSSGFKRIGIEELGQKDMSDLRNERGVNKECDLNENAGVDKECGLNEKTEPIKDRSLGIIKTPILDEESKSTKKNPLFNEEQKLTKTKAYDTFTRKRGFGIGKALLNLELEDHANKSEENNFLYKKRSSNALFERNNNQNDLDEEQKSPNAFDTFTRKRGFGIGKALLDFNNKIENPNADTNSLSGDDEMSDVNVEMFAVSEAPAKINSTSAMDELLGIHSFKPEDIFKKRHSAAGLRDAGNVPGFIGIRKWNNSEELDGDDGFGSKWVIGDSDSEPVIPKLPEEQLLAGQQFTTNSPPESIASSLATTLSSNIETDINLSKENSEIVENEPPEKITPKTQETQETQEVQDATPPENTFVPIQNVETEEAETEWQYRLPSPPTAFRDSSPTLVENLTNYESTEQFKTDSVVTSPELFEKLKQVKETQSEISEDEKLVFNNKLSLENLEKRKSLVYNRELATSLKYKDEDTSTQKTESVSSKRSSVLSELEEVISNSKSGTLNKNAKQPTDNFVHSDSNLPNFKITTYDMPKKKINIFEDDSIRSNENACKNISNLLKSQSGYVGRSMENLSVSYKKPEHSISNINRYKSKTLARTNAEPVGRSESFSAGNWVPANPVKRSKSQVAINQYKEDMDETSGDGALSKANSLFDVSGLQSLEVMRKIQTKLKTPSTSTDELDRVEPAVPPKPAAQNPETPKPQPQHNDHRYGPPSINLGTWSERPKSQITLKDDTDYKFNVSNTKYIASSKSQQAEKPLVNLRVNGIQQNQVRLNGVEQTVRLNQAQSVRLNGSQSSVRLNENESTRFNEYSKSNNDSINQQPAGNVIIKIGGIERDGKKDEFTSRFINHTTATGFRKPLGNVNTFEKQRPHSVAFDPSFDISRVPRVHSVELKKPFKDLNKSITQICPQNEPETKSLNYSVNNGKGNQLNRVSSFSQNTQTQNDFSTNKNVPFAQVKLRRTDSNKNAQVVNNNNNNSIFGNVVLRNTANRFSNGVALEKTPPPPVMPSLIQANKNVSSKSLSQSGDPRDELLSAIRNFGGKKGLKSVKV